MPRHREAGSALVQVLVAVGILGAVAAGLSGTLTNAFKSQNRVAQDADLAAIRNVLVQRVDCLKTLGAPPSACASAVTLRDKKNKIIADAAGTVFGKWTVIATCDPTNGSISVQAARPKAGGGFHQDPLNPGITQDWANARGNLFPANAGLCASSFATSVGGAFCAGGTARAFKCHANEALAEVDFESKQVCCRTLPAPSNCHFYSHGNLADSPGCNFNVTDGDDCGCPAGQTLHASDLYTCPSDPRTYMRCWCCVN